MANAILAIRAGLKRHGKSCFDYEIPKDVAVKIGTKATYGGASAQSGNSGQSTSRDTSVPMDTSGPSHSKDAHTPDTFIEEDMDEDLSFLMLI